MAAVPGPAKNCMSANVSREFVDSNILVYLFDHSAKTKQASAAQLIERLWNSGTACLNVQVLQEFFVSVTRKVPRPLSSAEALERVREFSAWRVFAPGAPDVATAIEIHRQTNLSFWDAMIVQAASELGCDLIWSEDLSNGHLVRGVRIQNPFVIRP